MNVSYRTRGKRPEKDPIHEALNVVKNDTKISPSQRTWLFGILGILRNGGYARVLADNCLIDIVAVADTPHYAASFFDVYNRIDRFRTNVMPIRVDKPVNSIVKLNPESFGGTTTTYTYTDSNGESITHEELW